MIRESQYDKVIATLLPCPFCGSNDVDPEGWATSGGIAGPACNGCQASTGSALQSTFENIASWNTRSEKEPAEVAELREQLATARALIADYERVPC